MDSLPEISLGTAALVIFACCAGYMLLRGIAHTLVNAACLTLSVWVGFRVWQQAPSLAIDMFGKPSNIVAIGLPFAAFLATFFFLRKVMGLFQAPILRIREDVAPSTGGQLVFRLLITLIPAALFCLIAATFVHHAGSVAEIRNPANPGWAGKMKKSLSATIPEKLMNWLDPMASKPRVHLAKMIAAGAKTPLEPVTNPATGKPYPRAIIVDDPALKNLAREGRYSTLLRHPRLSKALKDPKIRQALGL